MFVVEYIEDWQHSSQASADSHKLPQRFLNVYGGCRVITLNPCVHFTSTTKFKICVKVCTFYVILRYRTDYGQRLHNSYQKWNKLLNSSIFLVFDILPEELNNKSHRNYWSKHRLNKVYKSRMLFLRTLNEQIMFQISLDKDTKVFFS